MAHRDDPRAMHDRNHQLERVFHSGAGGGFQTIQRNASPQPKPHNDIPASEAIAIQQWMPSHPARAPFRARCDEFVRARDDPWAKSAPS